ncbi:MAG TPA: 5-bromo-4-chloroindolyl phosphate hydrolase [Desulfobulbus sp.]|nr:5-bromo-4-chloroindolyl phosphate hydrolase [Desulfobulbus sp.]
MTARRIRKKSLRWHTRGIFLWILPLPLIPAFFITLLRGNLMSAVGNLAALILFWVGALFIRKGLKSELKYEERRMVRAPRRPLKIYGAVAVSLGAFFCSRFGIDHSLLFSLFPAALAFAGCWLAYGFDPRRDKVGDIKDGFGYTSEEILAAIESAEQKIVAIEKSARGFGNQEVISRLGRITALAHRIVHDLEDDPHDLRKIRKFINVYLDGLQKVTTGYAQAMQKSGSDVLEPRFSKLLDTIEEVFAEQDKKLMADDILDLDIQMEVLMKQLRHEGVL